MKRAGIPLVGAALLVGTALLRLPPPRDLLRPVATPFDRTRDPGAGPILVLLTQAATLIPEGSSVAVGAVSRIPEESVYCRLLAASLLPGRDVLPVQSGAEADPRADFLILAGADPPADVPGRLSLRTPQGALWKLRR